MDFLQRQERSLAAATRLLAWPLYQQAEKVLLFASVRSELDTRFLAEESLRLGKRVAMPRCLPKSRSLLLLKIESWEDLKPSYYDLLEPSPTAPAIPASELDLIVVPGVIFSPSGYRIGYGGGYYDRLMAEFANVPTVGLAFELQVIPTVPRDVHDKPVDFLVTEERIWDCQVVRDEQVKKGVD